MRVAIQGEAGSNSHAATREMVPGAEIVACMLSADVFDRVEGGAADVAVLPIENSLHGSVVDHYDLLLSRSLVAVAELRLRVRHALIAPQGVTLETLHRVLSHPVALSQCRKFFAANPQMDAVPFYDTAGAAKHAVLERPAATAAIARPEAAEIYGGVVLQSDLEDDPQNYTRFFLLVPAEQANVHRPAEPVSKMSVVFAIEHRPGSLVEVLQHLAGLGADLTRIESRPVPGKPWEYTFYLDLGLPTPETADAVLAALTDSTRWVKELGRYAAGR